VTEKVHRWLFYMGEVGYVDADGLAVRAEEYFLGTRSEAMAEAERRAELAAKKQGVDDKMVVEGHGVIE